MYLISKILFGTLSTLSDLDDIECTNQFELLGNGGRRKRYMRERKLVYSRDSKEQICPEKKECAHGHQKQTCAPVSELLGNGRKKYMKERKLVYSRVSKEQDSPKDQICPEKKGCAHGHQKQNCAPVPEDSINEEIKKVIAMLPETFAAYRRSVVPPPGFVESSGPCCKRNKINGSSPCIILNRPVTYDYCKECSRINLFIPEQYSDAPPCYIIVDPKTFLSAINDNKLPKPQSQSPSPLSSPTCVERSSRTPDTLGMPNWTPQSRNCQHRLSEHPTHSQLEGAAERLVENLKSLLPNPEDLPKGFGIAEGPCCEKAAHVVGNIALKSSANMRHIPALCPEHRHCGLFPVVIDLSRGIRPKLFPGRFVNWNEQAARDAKKIVKFLMSPLADEKNLPAGCRVVYWPCCTEANKYPVEIPVEIPIPGHADKTINVAYCPRDKQFHIYRDNGSIYARHVVWNPNKKSGNDLPKTARQSRSLVYSRS